MPSSVGVAVARTHSEHGKVQLLQKGQLGDGETSPPSISGGPKKELRAFLRSCSSNSRNTSSQPWSCWVPSAFPNLGAFGEPACAQMEMAQTGRVQRSKLDDNLSARISDRAGAARPRRHPEHQAGWLYCEGVRPCAHQVGAWEPQVVAVAVFQPAKVLDPLWMTDVSRSYVDRGRSQPLWDRRLEPCGARTRAHRAHHLSGLVHVAVRKACTRLRSGPGIAPEREHRSESLGILGPVVGQNSIPVAEPMNANRRRRSWLGSDRPLCGAGHRVGYGRTSTARPAARSSREPAPISSRAREFVDCGYAARRTYR